jgi:penicillin-binding protein 1C
VDVCGPTGDLPNRYCPRTEQAWFIPGVSPIKVSDVYRPVALDPLTGRRACPGQGGPLDTRIYEFWPSNLLELFRQAGLPRRTPPPFAADCSLTDTAGTGTSPRIITPQPTVTYSLRPQRLAQERIAFQASADADARTLFWFLDGQFLGRGEPGEAFWWQPRPGRYEVRVVDDLGRADGVEMRVELLPEGR